MLIALLRKHGAVSAIIVLLIYLHGLLSFSIALFADDKTVNATGVSLL